ncbi:LysR family transcriptional regulator [Rhodobacterales bacterium HKCCE3408]|nr:LysR family transcriptional regulator [Rhodobacterales bacterium HKCCE3408]
MQARHVELIVAIADAGSLGAAADRLGRSQPALTKALKRAEEELGAQLFHRGAHGAIPTAEGARVIERCRRIQRDLAALDEDIAQGRGAVTGRIGVIVSPLAAMKIIPPVLARFRRRFLGVRVQIMGGHAPRAFRSLMTAEADFVIGPGPEPGSIPGLSAEPLLTTGLDILSGANGRHATVSDPADLAGADWAAIGPIERRPYFVELLARAGLRAPDPVVTSDSILSILSTLETSDLLCTFPSVVVPDLLPRWRVVRLPIAVDTIGVRIALTQASGRIQTPAALAFADLVREESARLRAITESNESEKSALAGYDASG